MHIYIYICVYVCICSICNMGMSDFPEIYAKVRGRSPSAYISGKSQVPTLQLIIIFHLGDSPASVGKL